MFGLLKKKISEFVTGLTKKEEEKAPEVQKEPTPQREPPKKDEPEEEKPVEIREEKPKERAKAPERQKEAPKPAKEPEKEEKAPVFEKEKPKERKPTPAEKPVEKSEPERHEKREAKPESKTAIEKPAPKQEMRVHEIHVKKEKPKEPEIIEAPKRVVEKKPDPQARTEKPQEKAIEKPVVHEKTPEPPAKREEKGPAQKREETKPQQAARHVQEVKKPEPPEEFERPQAEKKREAPAHEEKKTAQAHAKKQAEKIEPLTPSSEAPDLSRLEKRAGGEDRAIKPKLNIVSTITSIFSDQVTIKESDVAELLDTLELSLLEGDVAFEVSSEIVQSIRGKLVGAKVPKGKFSDSIKNAIRSSLVEVMSSAGEYDLFAKADKSKKPFKILFVGPNGAGKTTTMAKIANSFMKDGKSVVFAACDTFRAAAIEQLEVHAQRLGVKVIKNQYGSDPASVAFDAVKHAQSNNIDIVLIDSSGRQDTNANLIAELKKMERVVKPDAKIYIGESLAGNAVIAQVGAFREAIGIDGVILTKLDCDPKGGSAISITKATGVPIIFVGTGQKYEDIRKFAPDEIADEMVAS
ncbi:MAG: signal recognition particle-docking protein FtsY [Candidatus Micrarchaeia archaeon]